MGVNKEKMKKTKKEIMESQNQLIDLESEWISKEAVEELCEFFKADLWHVIISEEFDSKSAFNDYLDTHFDITMGRKIKKP